MAYAGSLADLVEHRLGPAFEAATGIRVAGVAKGSRALANEIAGRARRADVFISASPSVNASLMGPEHGDLVRWYVTFARSPLVVAYAPRSRFAQDFGTRPWYEVLQEPDIRIGRTDPALDPKGELTLELLDRTAAALGDAGLARRILGPAENPRQVFPEQDLLGRLQAGQLDAAFLYAGEAAAQGVPHATPDPSVDPAAEYTVTILADAAHRDEAVAFVRFLLGREGGAILASRGFDPLAPVLFGDASALPAELRALVGDGR